MVEVNELRIGNWLWHSNYQQSVMVKQIHPHPAIGNTPAKTLIWFNNNHKEGNRFYSDIKQFEGIDLTPELLEDCGFRQEDTFESIAGDKGIMFCNDELILYVCIFETEGIRLISGSYVVSRPFQYLHQLQNLYLDLTGKEMTINAKG